MSRSFFFLFLGSYARSPATDDGRRTTDARWQTAAVRARPLGRAPRFG